MVLYAASPAFNGPYHQDYGKFLGYHYVEAIFFSPAPQFLKGGNY